MPSNNRLNGILLGSAVLLSGIFTCIPSHAQVVDFTSVQPSAADVIKALATNGGAEGAQHAIDLNVQFSTNSAQLTTEAEKILEAVSIAMKSPELDKLSFRIEGHTDIIGSAVLNQRLSDARATSVFGYLVQKGVAPTRMEAKGFGSSNPLDKVHPASAKNRRVRIASLLTPAAESPATSSTQTTTSVVSDATVPPAMPVKLHYKLYMLASGMPPAHVVDPGKTVFHTGDAFYLEFGSSITGIFDMWSVSPDGKSRKLGRWQTNSAGPLRLPPNGTQISFTGKPGKESLLVQYYPCRLSDRRNLELTPQTESAMVSCDKIGEVPFRGENGRSLEITSSSSGASGETQIPVATLSSWSVSMVQFSIVLDHQ